jgi:hypothetical protein
MMKKCSCRGLHTMIVQFVILLWRGFNHVKLLDWNVNKSASCPDLHGSALIWLTDPDQYSPECGSGS